MIDTRFYRSMGSFTLSELIEGLAVELPDEKLADEVISGASALATSTAGQISFLEKKKHSNQAVTAKATACFVPEKIAELIGTRHIIPIVSDTPRAHFARCLNKLVSALGLHETGLTPNISKTAQIHPTAIIGDGAVIEDDVTAVSYTHLTLPTICSV